MRPVTRNYSHFTDEEAEAQIVIVQMTAVIPELRSGAVKLVKSGCWAVQGLTQTVGQ